MHIRICPTKLLREMVSGDVDRCAAIIFSSYDLPVAETPRCPYIFRKFEDLDREIPGRSFCEADAIAIRIFLRCLDPRTQTLFCCCDAAQSRSPAAAAALKLYYGQDDMPIWQDPRFHPNVLLFSTLCHTLGIKLTDHQIDLRVYENMTAFENAIRRSR